MTEGNALDDKMKPDPVDRFWALAGLFIILVVIWSALARAGTMPSIAPFTHKHKQAETNDERACVWRRCGADKRYPTKCKAPEYGSEEAFAKVRDQWLTDQVGHLAYECGNDVRDLKLPEVERVE